MGGHVLRLALTDDRVTRIVAPTRRALLPHPKLQNPIVDGGSLPNDVEWWGADAAICTIGTTRAKAGSAEAFRAIDHDYALAIATRVREGGASRFALVTSMGADPRSRFLYTRTKGELEAAVSRLAFPSLTIVRPGFLGGERDEARPLERITGAVLRVVNPVLPAAARISPAETVAALLFEAALEGAPGTHVVGSAGIARAATRGGR